MTIGFEKTYKTAVVLIPPREVWDPIQALRQKYDRQVRRWMPHVNLLYPFVNRERFEDVTPLLRQACKAMDPFHLNLGRFGHFDHGHGSYTLWLAPEPKEAAMRLHGLLRQAVPHCDDTARFANGFTPHLSVGQVHGHRELEPLKRRAQREWPGVSFMVAEICLIWRNDPPDDVFRVDRTIALGRRGAS